MSNILCPKCFRHKHEEVVVHDGKKRWVVDRCANCHFNFDIKDLM